MVVVFWGRPLSGVYYSLVADVPLSDLICIFSGCC